MKSKIAVLFLIVLLCLTLGYSNTSHIAEQPAPVASSGSNEALDQADTAQATEKIEVEQPRSTEPEYSAPPQKEQPSSLIVEKAALIRLLLRGYEPKEKPDDRFYDAMREFSAIGNNIHQISVKANALGFIDTQKLNSELDRLHKFQADMERQFLRPGESNLKWQ